MSSGEQNVEFREPESGAGLEAVRAWAFEKAREEPLKYAAWLALNAVTESVTSLQGLLEPGDKAAEEWAGEATQGGKQFAYAMWLALDATVNGLCSPQDKLPPVERWDRIKRTAHLKDQHGDREESSPRQRWWTAGHTRVWPAVHHNGARPGRPPPCPARRRKCAFCPSLNGSGELVRDLARSTAVMRA